MECEVDAAKCPQQKVQPLYGIDPGKEANAKCSGLGFLMYQRSWWQIDEVRKNEALPVRIYLHAIRPLQVCGCMQVTSTDQSLTQESVDHSLNHPMMIL